MDTNICAISVFIPAGQLWALVFNGVKSSELLVWEQVPQGYKGSCPGPLFWLAYRQRASLQKSICSENFFFFFTFIKKVKVKAEVAVKGPVTQFGFHRSSGKEDTCVGDRRWLNPWPTQNSSWGWKPLLGLRVPLGGGKELAHSVSKEIGQPLVWVVPLWLDLNSSWAAFNFTLHLPSQGEGSLPPFNLRKWYLVISKLLLGLGCALFNSVTSNLYKAILA